MKKNVFIMFLLVVKLTSAQLPSYQHHTERVSVNTDSTSLQSFFRNGKFYGHGRYYFMATDNDRQLKDFYANAFGMGIGYESAAIKGFQFGLSGYFIYNLYSSDFTQTDAATKVGSRYEIGQFDMLNPANRHDMDRLEDLYLKYSYQKSTIKFGKQHIKTPFINPQDGRMRPTLVEGLLFDWNPIQKIKVEGGWLFGVSPRSTVGWYGIGQSMSIFGTGVNPNGKPSGYAGNVNSNAVYFAGVTMALFPKTKLQVWNLHIDNVLNSSLLQLNMDYPLSSRLKLQTGLQYIEQHAINDGGNANQTLTYVTKGNVARTFGGRLGVAGKSWTITANYNRITKEGRYLMPREWGRDPFFTFMSRERNEGLGDVHAMNTVLSKKIGQSGLVVEGGYGHYYLPDVKNTQLNKYGMPSYWQTNLDVRYLFKGTLQGLELQFLYVYKGKLGETYSNDKFVINKVDMSLYNLILNFHF